MPPRHSYWTILIGDSPTAFRARDREELLPTFERLRAKQPDAVLRWFERGRLWTSPQEARGPAPLPAVPVERRDKQWRPGGAHKDPRDRERFKKKKPGTAPGERRGWTPKSPSTGQVARPWQPKPPGGGTTDRPWRPKPPGGGTTGSWRPRPAGGATGDKPWRGARSSAPGERRPWTPKPAPKSPGRPTGSEGTRPWQPKPAGGDRRPWSSKPDRGQGDRPWRPKPAGGQGDRPWRPKPAGGQGDRPWRPKPADGQGDRPWRPKPDAKAGETNRRPAPGPRPNRPPREPADQGPPADRTPREERGRKGGTRLVKKVRR